MTTEIYTAGYGSTAPAHLFRILDELGAILVDIRYSPYGKPAWRKPVLQKALGNRYLHLWSLGNANYKTGGMRIVNYASGRAFLATMKRPALLLCACHSPVGCHRTVVGDMLRADGFTVTELNPPAAKPSEPAQEQLSFWGDYASRY